MQSPCTESQAGYQVTASSGVPVDHISLARLSLGRDDAAAPLVAGKSSTKRVAPRGGYDTTGMINRPGTVSASRSGPVPCTFYQSFSMPSQPGNKAPDMIPQFIDYPYIAQPFTRNTEREVSISSKFLGQADRLISALHPEWSPECDTKSLVQKELGEMLKAQGNLSESSAVWREEPKVAADGEMGTVGSLYILKTENLDPTLVKSSVCEFEGGPIDVLSAWWERREAKNGGDLTA